MPGNLILIIDDEPIHHMVLEEYLEASGYRVLHAENGEQGVAMVQMHEPDLVLLDIQMPVMDGFQTLDAIRSQPEIDDIPVLYLTSRDEQPHKVKGFELGADDYITKPFHKAELLARIRAVLRRSSRRKNRDAGMKGDFSDISLSDLLMSMEIGNKTATIFIETNDARIFIENGMLVCARLNTFTGNAALARIFLNAWGTFTVKFDPLPEDNPKEPEHLRSVLISVLTALELDKDEFVSASPRRTDAICQIREALKRTERQQQTEGVMSGDFANVGLSDLLQNLEQGCKTASITLEDLDGEIFIEDGYLLLARQGIFTGDEALKRIFLMERGHFSVRFNDLPAKTTETPRPLMSVLMGILANVDELKERLQRLQVDNVRVAIEDNASEFPEIQKFNHLFPMPFVDLLTLMENNISDNLNMLIQAAKKGKLKKVKWR